MFGTYFYHQRIRTCVALFGAMFNNISIMRTNAEGDSVSTIKVPLSYAPKRKYIERLLENPDLQNDTKVAIKLPRMSFEIISMTFDPTRQLSKVNQRILPNSNSLIKTKFYAPTPYIIGFQLNIYAKSHDDALQVVEQVIPFFNPQYTLTIKPLKDFPSITEDVPLVLSSITFSDDYEGALEARRTIIYSLDFEMKINFYGPTNSGEIIRQVDANLGLMGYGLNDSDVLTERIRVTPNPFDVNPDSDYGFTTEITQLIDSA
jgi:T4-like virus Myoviridae tail sheath stabiliser